MDLIPTAAADSTSFSVLSRVQFQTEAVYFTQANILSIKLKVVFIAIILIFFAAYCTFYLNLPMTAFFVLISFFPYTFVKLDVLHIGYIKSKYWNKQENPNRNCQICLWVATADRLIATNIKWIRYELNDFSFISYFKGRFSCA